MSLQLFIPLRITCSISLHWCPLKFSKFATLKYCIIKHEVYVKVNWLVGYNEAYLVVRSASTPTQIYIFCKIITNKKPRVPSIGTEWFLKCLSYDVLFFRISWEGQKRPSCSLPGLDGWFLCLGQTAFNRSRLQICLEFRWWAMLCWNWVKRDHGTHACSRNLRRPFYGHNQHFTSPSSIGNISPFRFLANSF